MSDEIIKILDDLGRRFGVVIDWSSENIMPYLQDLMQRYINYEVMTSVMWIVVALIVIIGLSISIPVINKHANKVLEENHYSDWDFWQMVSDLDFYYYNWIFIIIIGCFVICIICQSIDIITCYTIPEKMIFEYLNFLSSNG